LIRHGRNQAMHWEEEKDPTERSYSACFEALAEHFGDRFRDYAICNLAWDIVDLLQWRDASGFRSELESLA